MHKIILSILIIFSISDWSCTKDNKYIDIDITEYKWEVVKIRKSTFSYNYANEGYILDFLNNNDFSINLDVNTCRGIYDIKGDGLIEFGSLGCTEICCDSDFAVGLSALFLEMNEYYYTKDELYLVGKKENLGVIGEIFLKKYED